MRRKMKILILITLLILLEPMLQPRPPELVQRGTGKAVTLSPRIKSAMTKMGPFKHYRFVGSQLQVKVNGEWLRLRY